MITAMLRRLRTGVAVCLATAAKLAEPPALARCTGISASWCPIHGDCVCTPTCPTCRRSGREHIACTDGLYGYTCNVCGEEFDNNGMYERNDASCPLHAWDSTHAEGVA